MRNPNQKKIIRLLGVGFDADDGHVRITKGENYDVLMGSDASHDYIQKLIQRIEDELKRRGIKLEDLTPEELGEFIKPIK